jgi:imidazolonepropionase-like amidohydrolase
MLAVTVGRLIDGTGREPIHDAVLLIDGERIKDVGRRADLGIPDDADVCDLGGMTVIPGMIDAHTHVIHSGETRDGGGLSWYDTSIPSLTLQASTNARKDLEAGVTTIRDVGSQGYIDVALRDAINAGLVVGPRMRVAGQGVSVTGGHMDPRQIPEHVAILGRTGVADGPDAMRHAARYQLKMGVDLIKINSDSGKFPYRTLYHQEMTYDEMRAVCEVAHWEDKFVATHCAGGTGTMDAIRAGVNTLEHAHWLTREHIDLMVKNGTFWVPTFTAPYNTLVLGRDAAQVPDYIWEWKTKAWEGAQASFELAQAAGVGIAVGTDAGYMRCLHGETAKEMLIMRDLGMHPLDVIRTVTLVSAQALNWAHEIGSLEPGKYADFVAIDGDLLSDLRLLLQPESMPYVMKGGSFVVNRAAARTAAA